VDCIRCGAKAVTERSDRTAHGYRRFRCRACGKQFNERAGTLLNRAQYPSDVIALVVLWRLRYKLSLRDLPEMFLIRGIVFSHEAVRDWKPNSRRHWPRVCVATAAARLVVASTSTRPTSR
jgi:transposase-like protein